MLRAEEFTNKVLIQREIPAWKGEGIYHHPRTHRIMTLGTAKPLKRAADYTLQAFSREEKK